MILAPEHLTTLEPIPKPENIGPLSSGRLITHTRVSSPHRVSEKEPLALLLLIETVLISLLWRQVCLIETLYQEGETICFSIVSKRTKIQLEYTTKEGPSCSLFFATSVCNDCTAFSITQAFRAITGYSTHLQG